MSALSMSSLRNCHSMCQPMAQGAVSPTTKASGLPSGNSAASTPPAINATVNTMNSASQRPVCWPKRRAVDLTPISASSSLS